MSYMMSKEQYLSDEGNHHWMAHLMFYTPLMDGAVWGADLPKSPVMLNPQFRGAPNRSTYSWFRRAGGRMGRRICTGHVGAGHVSKRQNLGPKFGMPIRSSRFSGLETPLVQMYVASHELIIVLCGVSSDQEVGKNAARAQVAMFPAPFRVTSEGVACGSPHPLTQFPINRDPSVFKERIHELFRASRAAISSAKTGRHDEISVTVSRFERGASGRSCR